MKEQDEEMIRRLAAMSAKELATITLAMLAHTLPKGLSVVTCGECTGPLFGVYSQPHDSLGYWCPKCNKGGATANAAVLEVDDDGELISLPHVPDSVTHAIREHDLHAQNPN